MRELKKRGLIYSLVSNAAKTVSEILYQMLIKCIWMFEISIPDCLCNIESTSFVSESVSVNYRLHTVAYNMFL